MMNNLEYQEAFQKGDRLKHSPENKSSFINFETNKFFEDNKSTNSKVVGGGLLNGTFAEIDSAKNEKLKSEDYRFENIFRNMSDDQFIKQIIGKDETAYFAYDKIQVIIN